MPRLVATESGFSGDSLEGWSKNYLTAKNAEMKKTRVHCIVSFCGAFVPTRQTFFVFSAFLAVKFFR